MKIKRGTFNKLAIEFYFMFLNYNDVHWWLNFTGMPGNSFCRWFFRQVEACSGQRWIRYIVTGNKMYQDNNKDFSLEWIYCKSILINQFDNELSFFRIPVSNPVKYLFYFSQIKALTHMTISLV